MEDEVRVSAAERSVSRQEREVSHWKEWKNKADTVWGWQTPAGRVRADRRSILFRELGGLNHNSVVLEIGCGTGEFTVRIAGHVRELVATDLTSELLSRARQRVAQECPGANVIFATEDAMNLQQPNNKFDAAFGCSVLHHLDAVLALKELLRVLKPGGRCVFSEPNMLNPQIALQKNVEFIKRKVGDSPDERAFFNGQIKRLVQHAGFNEVRVRNFDFVHPLIPASLVPMAAKVGGVLEKVPGLRAFSGSLLISARKPK